MKENRKKRNAALIIILIALGIFTGSLIAYFSDIVIGNANVTAGTLDITGDYEIYLNGSTTPETSNDIPNLNPGDYFVIKGTIINGGTKSAWIRGVIEVEGTLAGALIPGTLDPVIEVYEGEVDPTTGTPGTPIPINQGQYASTNWVINGSEEIETLPNVVTTYDSAFTIYFSPDADNTSQAGTLELDVMTQALQYRNNTTIPSDATWNTVVTQEYGN